MEDLTIRSSTIYNLEENIGKNFMTGIGNAFLDVT